MFVDLPSIFEDYILYSCNEKVKTKYSVSVWFSVSCLPVISNVSAISQTGIKYREDREPSLRLNPEAFSPIINLSHLTLTGGAYYFKRYRIW